MFAVIVGTRRQSKTLSRTSQKHSNGQAEDCGQFSHTRIMAGNEGIGESEGGGDCQPISVGCEYLTTIHGDLCGLVSAVIPAGKVGHLLIKVSLQFLE